MPWLKVDYARLGILVREKLTLIAFMFKVAFYGQQL
jgi:hypothetical protein